MTSRDELKARLDRLPEPCLDMVERMVDISSCKTWLKGDFAERKEADGKRRLDRNA
jgi:hypothetical protein